MDRDLIMEYAAGNQGAMGCLLGTRTADNQVAGLVIANKLEKCKSIRGTNIWVLFSDLAGRSYDKMARICDKVPDEVLEDACNRQDYSGRSIIEPYLNN
jgi:hypothetical protein